MSHGMGDGPTAVQSTTWPHGNMVPGGKALSANSNSPAHIKFKQPSTYSYVHDTTGEYFIRVRVRRYHTDTAVRTYVCAYLVRVT